MRRKGEQGLPALVPWQAVELEQERWPEGQHWQSAKLEPGCSPEEQKLGEQPVTAVVLNGVWEECEHAGLVLVVGQGRMQLGHGAVDGGGPFLCARDSHLRNARIGRSIGTPARCEAPHKTETQYQARGMALKGPLLWKGELHSVGELNLHHS